MVGERHATSFKAGLVTYLMASVAGIAVAAAQSAPAGQVIGTQASATYVDAQGETVSITSNVVQSTVREIAAVDLGPDGPGGGAPDQSRSAPRLGRVTFHHELTNNGNDSDSFAITAADSSGDSADFQNIVVYADANRDGRPDSSTPLTTTPDLMPGDDYGIIVEASVSNSVAAGDNVDLTIIATSTKDNTVSDQNLNRVNIIDGALIETIKSFDRDRADPGDTRTVTLRYQNKTGVDTPVELKDVLDDNFTLVPGSIKWSHNSAGTDALITATQAGTDTTGNGGITLTSSLDAVDSDDVTFLISSVRGNSVGTISFDVVVNDETAVDRLENVAMVTSDTDNDGDIDSDDDSVQSNTAILEINGGGVQISIADAVATAKVDSGADGPSNLSSDPTDRSETDDDSTLNDVVEENEPLTQGARVPFEFVLSNNGNKSDRVQLTVENGTLPSDGPYLITDATGAPLQADPSGGYVVEVPGREGTNPGTTRVRVVVNLPVEFTRSASEDSHIATITATPKSGASADTSTLALKSEVNAGQVDLINRDTGSFNGDETPAAPEGNGGVGNAVADQTNAGNPFTTVVQQEPAQPLTFALQLTPGANSGGVYNLEASFAGNQLTDGNDGGFAADNVVDFPSGSEVEFRDNNGNTITNTGVLAADEAYEFTAHVTLPTNTSPDDYDIRFRAYSPVTGVDDQKLDRISVERFVDIGISPPTNENTILAGGVTEYKHTLTNNGNIDLMAGDVEVSDSPNNFQAVLYYDANANGEIDTGEPVISNLSQLSSSGLASGLASGEQANLILRVTAPATANTGVTDTITIIVGNALQVTGGIDADDAIELNNVSSDLTTIVGKVLELLKEQAADNECNGPADGAFGIGQLEISPGQCINYRVTATNNGDQPVEQVVIIDKTPDFTKLESSEAGTEINATNAGVAIGSENLEAIDDGGAGALQAEIGTLAPGQDGVLNYTVRVDE